MSRRAQSMPPMLMEKPKRKPIVAVICFSWKVFTCIFSHVALVSMVVAYCIAGALIFEHLEAENEKTVKQGVRGMRANVTDDLWDMTTNFDYLRQDNWTRWVENRLEVFERDILTAMKTKGWDGNENEQQMQWTFFGALFYSIIVITTIGYGHIAPKTDMGKVITIFYAILGIPLMLLCLSNIGDVMASSFRFLYWRVCCYVCTREPKRVRRMRQSRMNMRPPPTRTRSQPPPNMRRSMRISQKSADSGFATRSDYEQNLVHSFSDPQLRHSSKHSTKKGNRSREDFKYDMHDERPRNRHDRDGRSPNSSRRPTGKVNDDDMYNSRDRRDNRYDDRRDDRYGGRSRVRERTPEEDWSDRERGRGSGRMRDYPRNYDRRASDYGYTLDPYDDVDDSPRNTGHFDRAQRFSDRGRTRERLHDRHTVERERNVRDSDRLDPVADVDSPSNHRRSQSVRSARGRSIGRDLAQGNSNTLPSAGRSKGIDLSPKSRARSVDPRAMRQSVEPDEYGIVENRYAKLVDNGNGTASKANRREKPPEKANRSYSLPRPQKNSYDRGDKRDRVDRLEVPDAVGNRRRPPEREYDDEFDEDYRMLGGRRDSHHGQMPAHLAQRRGTKVLPPSPRIMSPMGFAVHRQAKYTKSAYEDDLDYYMDSEFDSNTDLDPGNRPVPIWLCVFLVVGYIIAGAFLFSEWEHWSFLDSAYFCFITLTTIGFGDFVPAQGVKENSEVSIALCSLYLLFGISLLAMSFNLVQEEVISNVKSVARRLGILKEQDAEE